MIYFDDEPAPAAPVAQPPPVPVNGKGGTTNAELDAALLTLKSGDESARREAYGVVKAAHPFQVSARMAAVRPLPSGLVDSMGQAHIHPAPVHKPHKRAVVFQCSGGFHTYTAKAIDRVRRFLNDPDTLYVVFAADNGAYQYFKGRPHILVIRTTLIAQPRPWMTAALYAAAKIVNAEQFLFLESDVVCLSDPSEIWRTMNALDRRSILGVRGQWGSLFAHPLACDFVGVKGGPEDADFVTGNSPTAHTAPFIFNGGVIAGHRDAINDVDNLMREAYPRFTLAGEGLNMAWIAEVNLMYAINKHGFTSHLHSRFNHTVFYGGSKLCNWTKRVENDELVMETEGRSTVFAHFVGGTKNTLFSELAEDLDRYPVRLAKA